MGTLISVNGHVSPAADATISPLDRGFMLGDGVFETLRVVDGVIWYLDRHLNRLNVGAARIGIPIPPELRRWTTEIVACASNVEMDEFVLRVTLSRGIASRHGLARERLMPPTVVLATLAMPAVPAEMYDRGIRARVSSCRRYEGAPTAGIKTTSYLESVLVLQEATTTGFDDGILLDTRGFVAEASASNLFAWIGDTLVTPARSCGIVPGITRSVVLELALRMGISAIEGEFTLEELAEADEAFLTSSLRGIVPLVSIGEYDIGVGRCGPKTQRFMAAYAGADRESARLGDSTP